MTTEKYKPVPLWIELTPTLLMLPFIIFFGGTLIFSHINTQKENKLLSDNHFIVTPGKMTSLVVDDTDLLNFMKKKNLQNITIQKINNNLTFLANQMIDNQPTIYFEDHIILKDFFNEKNISQHVQQYVLKNIKN